MKAIIATITFLMVTLLTSCSQDKGALPEPKATSTQPAELETVSFGIEGMDCGGCAAGITKKVAALGGVESCDLTFESKTAVIVYDKAQISPETISKEIVAMKYKVEQVDTPAPTEAAE